MMTLDEQAARQAAERAALEKAWQIAGRCPVEPDSVQLVSTGELSWLHYQVGTLREAVDLLQQWQIVPYSVARTGCLYTKPVEIMSEAQRDVAQGSYAVSLDVDQGAGFGPSVTLSAYVRLETLHRVRIKIGDGRVGALSATQIAERDHRGRIVSRRWQANSTATALCDEVTKYGSGSDDAAHFAYRWMAEYAGDQPGTNLRHTVCQLLNLSETIREAA